MVLFTLFSSFSRVQEKEREAEDYQRPYFSLPLPLSFSFIRGVCGRILCQPSVFFCLPAILKKRKDGWRPWGQRIRMRATPRLAQPSLCGWHVSTETMALQGRTSRDVTIPSLDCEPDVGHLTSGVSRGAWSLRFETWRNWITCGSGEPKRRTLDGAFSFIYAPSAFAFARDPIS